MSMTGLNKAMKASRSWDEAWAVPLPFNWQHNVK